jgi:hypothetical protein
MDLVNYVKTHGDLASLPNGMHAVVPAAPERGLVPGVIFALRNRNDGVNINRQNRLHPYYLVYVAQDGTVIANHTEAKRLLDLARAACKERQRTDSGGLSGVQQGHQGWSAHGCLFGAAGPGHTAP